jgi:hypothetical protein
LNVTASYKAFGDHVSDGELEVVDSDSLGHALCPSYQNSNILPVVTEVRANVFKLIKSPLGSVG